MAENTLSRTELFNALHLLLDREREALLEGKLREIPAIMTQKSDLIEQLSEADIDRAEVIRPLQHKLRRNQALFDQALAGIRSVAERLGALRNVGKSLDIYDGQGRRARIGNEDKGRLERRA